MHKHCLVDVGVVVIAAQEVLDMIRVELEGNVSDGPNAFGIAINWAVSRHPDKVTHVIAGSRGRLIDVEARLADTPRCSRQITSVVFSEERSAHATPSAGYLVIVNRHSTPDASNRLNFLYPTGGSIRIGC